MRLKEFDTPEKKAQRDALMKQYLAKGGKVQKVPTGQTAYKGKELKPAFKKDPALKSTPITSPMSDESKEQKPSDKQVRQAKGIAFDKRYKGGNYTGAHNTIEKLKKGLTKHPDVADALRRANEEMNRIVDEACKRHKAKEEAGSLEERLEAKLKEEAPFDGMSLVRMALMRKFITAEEWYHLKDKWKAATQELEQRYDDWPEDQGFGSSDHAYAIKELMELVGYEFDDQDRSGRFVVSKMPPELEKAGIKNARMRDAQTTEDAVDTSKWKDNAIIRNYPPDDLDGDSYVWKGGQWIHDETGKVAPRDVGKILTKLTKDEELSGDLEGGIIRDSSLTDQQKQGLQKINTKYGNYFGNNADPLPQGYIRARFDTGIGTDGIESDELEAALKKFGYEDMDDAEAKDEDFYDTVQEYLPITNAMTNDMAKVMGNDIDDDDKMVDALTYLDSLDESIREDAGEQGLANELSKYYQDAADGLDPEDHGNDEHEDYLDIARSFKKGLQAGMDSVNNSGWEFSTNDFDMDRDGKGKMYEPMAELLKKYNVSAGIENGESFLTKNGKAITKPAQESVEEDMIPNNMPGNIGDYAHEKSTGKLVRIVDYTDDDEGIYTISYGEGQGETDVTAGDLEFIDPTVNQDLDDKILDKEIDEAPIEQDRDNPIAKPYVDTPEWKALHDMDDKIIQAYIKHKEVAEADGLQPADLKRLGQHEPKVYVHKDGKTIMVPRKQAKNYIAKGWKKSALRAETSYESKLADMLNQRLK